MAIEVTRLAWDVILPSSPQKFVLVKLADHAHPDGSEARPSVALIAAHTSLSRRAVFTALNELRTAGIISVQREADRGTRRPTTYRLHLDRLKELAASSGRLKASYPSAGDAPVPEQTEKLVHEAHLNGAPGAPKPSLNHPTRKLASSGSIEIVDESKPEPAAELQPAPPPQAAKPASGADIAELGREVLRVIGYPAGSVLHFGPVGAWLANFTPVEIRAAAHAISARIPPNLKNPLAWMSKAMPDEVAVIRRTAAAQVDAPASNREPPADCTGWRLGFWKAYGAVAFESWVRPLEVVRNGQEVELRSKSAFRRDWVMNSFGDKLRQLIVADDQTVQRVEFTVSGEKTTGPRAARQTA